MPWQEDDGADQSEGPGKPITGGQLFRRYLLNRCLEDLGRGWMAKEATAAAAATKAIEDEAIKAANRLDPNALDNQTSCLPRIAMHRQIWVQHILRERLLSNPFKNF